MLHVGFCVGVYLCKHADVISPEPLRERQSGALVIFKAIKVTAVHLSQ